MKLAEVADRLRVLAFLLDCKELEELANEIPRRPPVMKAPNKSARMTQELRARIHAYHVQHPDATQMEIAQEFNVNPGRVSETLAGFRT